jgi:hypothetical protein
MRFSLWLFFIAVCLVSALAQAPLSSAATRADNKGGRARTLPELVAPIEGYGETDDDARAQALNNAEDRVLAFLAERRGITKYKPSRATLQALNILPEAKDLEVTQIDLKIGPMNRAIVRLSVTPEQFEKLNALAHQQAVEAETQERQERAEKRQKLAGLGLAGFVALLLVGAGYLRLEEATKGYYTTLLRLAALSLLGGVGGVIWFLS